MAKIQIAEHIATSNGLTCASCNVSIPTGDIYATVDKRDYCGGCFESGEHEQETVTLTRADIESLLGAACRAHDHVKMIKGDIEHVKTQLYHLERARQAAENRAQVVEDKVGELYKKVGGCYKGKTA